jgi:hypothetical protein
MVIFKDGAEIERLNSAVGKAVLLEKLLPLLNK